MSRSLKKGPYVDAKLLDKVRAEKKEKGSGARIVIETRSRRTTIIPEFIGVTFNVHMGNGSIAVQVTDQMIGHKLGEFAPTKKRAVHGDNKKGKK